jgi:SAM-dependent methyltransferase
MRFKTYIQMKLFNSIKRDENPENLRTKILQDQFLRENYLYLIDRLVNQLDIYDTSDCNVLELGSAGGITDLHKSFVKTSDVRTCTGVNLNLDACKLQLDSDSIDGIFAKDVLHHLPDIEKHFNELTRVLKKGASASFIEPNWNWISRIIYFWFHPEPWIVNSQEVKKLSIETHASMANPMFSNQALPYLMFRKQINCFEKDFPSLKVTINEIPLNGLSFIISGGAFKRNKISSGFLLKLKKWEEKRKYWMIIFGVSRLITIRKVY